jgi:hypothetical protein
LWVCIGHHIIPYVDFLVKILLILPYDLDFTDQTKNNFPLYVVWAVGFVV